MVQLEWHEFDLADSTYFRQRDGLLVNSLLLRYEGELSQRSTGFATIEHALVNGVFLPDPFPDGSNGGWIEPWQWDFLIYAHGRAKLPGDLMYATWRAARDNCGLFEDLPRGVKGINAIKNSRSQSLVPRLVRAGLLEYAEGPYQNEKGTLEWKRLMLAPTWPATSPAPIKTNVGKTREALREHHRPWFGIPNRIFNRDSKSKRRSPWHRICSHRGRRVIAAVYLFYDGTTFSSVSPNHLRIEGTVLKASTEFLRACGAEATMRDVAAALSWLWLENLLFPVASSEVRTKPFPAGQTRSTWSHHVGRGSASDVTLLVPAAVPKMSEES